MGVSPQVLSTSDCGRAPSGLESGQGAPWDLVSVSRLTGTSAPSLSRSCWGGTQVLTFLRPVV